MATLILFNKPFRVLSQFTDEKPATKDGSSRKTLADYIPIADVYPAGRLDYDSEGLLLLTDDGQLQQHIANPKYKLEKTYWVEVEGAENPAAIEQLRSGITLKDGPTRPAKVNVIKPPVLWDRHPPVRFRQSIPTHWLSITISEGRNRQVRRMTAAVNLPTLRLVRASIGSWSIDNLPSGEYRSMDVPVTKRANNEPEKSSIKKRSKPPHPKKPPSYRQKK